MGFWGTVGATALSGIAVAIVAAFLAWLVTDRYAAARESTQARRERDLAAAADFYQLLGKFFAAWKAWEFHTRSDTHPVSDQRQSELISEAAAAEGAYEAFIVRVALEHDLSHDQRAALWCLRFALKQLRYAMREGKPLKWWRVNSPNPGHREYEAYKGLVSIIARILTEPGKESIRPDRPDRAVALKEITGSGEEFTNTPDFKELLTAEQQKPGQPLTIGDWGSCTGRVAREARRCGCVRRDGCRAGGALCAGASHAIRGPGGCRDGRGRGSASASASARPRRTP